MADDRTNRDNVIPPDYKAAIGIDNGDSDETPVISESDFLSAMEYHRMLDSTDEGVVLILDTNIQYVNSAITKILGYSVEEIIGMPFSIVIGPKHIEVVSRRYVERLQGKDVPSTYNITLKRKDGTVVPVEIQSSIFEHKGQLASLIMVRDITGRLAKDKALKESEQILATVLENLQAGIVLVDASTRDIVSVNTMASEMMGLPKEDIIGKDCNNFLCHTDKGKCPIFDLNLSVDNSECVLINSKGEEIPILKTATRITLGGQNFILDSFVDIREQKKIKDALKRSKEEYRDIALSSADWIWEFDANGKYTYTSEKVETILGYSPEEIIGKTPYDFMSKEEGERVGEIFNKIVLGKKNIVDLENINISKDDNEVYLLTNGCPILDEKGNLKGYRGIGKDITERKKAEDALRESERKYRLITEGSSDLISKIDLDGNYIYLSPSHKQLLGYTEKELIGKSGFDYVHPEDAKIMLRKFAESLENPIKNDSETLEFRIMNKSGDWHDLEATANFIFKESGEPDSILMVSKDVTTRKRAEATLKEKLDELERYKKVTIDRELKMIELKKRIRQLEQKGERNE